MSATHSSVGARGEYGTNSGFSPSLRMLQRFLTSKNPSTKGYTTAMTTKGSLFRSPLRALSQSFVVGAYLFEHPKPFFR